MAFQVIILLLVAGLVAFLAFEGLFNALIMALCAIFSAALAFNFYEPLAETMTGTVPEFAHAFALVALFVIPLTVMRVLADRFMPGMVHLPYPVDRAGGAIVGAVPALIIAGVLVIALRLMPFGPSILGYEFVAAPPDEQAGRAKPQSLWVKPEAFTVGLIELLSDGALSGQKPFRSAHPDFRLELAGFGDVDPADRRHSDAKALDPLEVKPWPSGSPAPYAAGAYVAAAASVNGDKDGPKSANTTVEVSGKKLPAFDVDGQLAALLRVTVRPARSEGEEDIWLTGGQAQLTVQQVEVGGKIDDKKPATLLLLPQWIVQDPRAPAKAEPFGVGRVWQAAPDSSGAAPICQLLFALPEGYAPSYLTVKRLTQVEVALLKVGQEVLATPTRAAGAVKPPPAAGPTLGPTAGIAVSGTWPADNWRRLTEGRLPLPLSVNGPDKGTGATGVGDATVELIGGRLASAQLQGTRVQFGSVTGGRQIWEYSLPANFTVVQLEGDVKAPISAELWARITKAVVRTSGKELPLAGIVLKTKRDFWLLDYANPDSDGFADRFKGANPDELVKAGGEIDNIRFIMPAPKGAKDLELDLGAGQKIHLDLPQ